MVRIIHRGGEYEGIEHFKAALDEREHRRAPFREQADSLFEEFLDFLKKKGLSARTVQNHSLNLQALIGYLVDYTEEEDFARIGKGNVRTNFFRWYRRKVLGPFDQGSLEASTKKFFRFLADEKGIWNEKVLGKPRKKR